MPKRNGFMCFAHEFEKTEKAKGRRFRCFKEIIPIAGRIWEGMGPRQREPYIRMAEQRPNEARTAKVHEASSSHRIVAVEPIDERIIKSKHITISIQNRLDQVVLGEEGLDKEEFYAISMKYFCRRFDGGYVPAELGVAKFSIEDGVKDQLHMHINPVSIPIGMQYEAQQHANTHGLPLPPHALGGTNMNEIAQKLLTFLDVKKEIPLLFTDAKNIPQVEQMLGEILGYHINGKTLYIGSMAELLFQLKQAAEYHMMSLKVFPSVTKAQQFLDDTTLILTTGISCEYHESLEFVAECALSECLCWSYTATLSCCLEMIVEPLPGKHYPYHLDPKRLYMLRQKFAIMDLQQIQSRKKESDHSKPANKRPQISNSNIYYQRVDQLTPQSLEERTDFRCSIEPEMGYIDLRVGDTGRRTFDRHHTH